METKTKHLSVANKIEELPALAAMLDQLGEEWDLNPGLVMSLNLVVEEALTNVIFYAFDDKEQHQIEVDITIAGQLLTTTISDDGKPFDPTKRDNPDITLSVDDRQIGGLGIFLIRKIMDQVNYKREQNKNVLILEKTI
jgi:serine/threonine-protein kinase RsbW